MNQKLTENTIAVSVCMPVYNGSGFLESAFKCLSEQTFHDFEVIVVDDGSADDSAAHAEKLMERYQLKGKVVKTPNRGCEQARDLACQHASSDIIAPFDCDDVWVPTYLQEMVGALRSADIGIVYCDFIEDFLDLGKTVRKSTIVPWIDLSLAAQKGDLYRFPEEKFFELLLQGQVMFPPCTMFKRELYEAAGEYSKFQPDLRISLDWSFGLRASRLSAVGFLNRPLLRKVVHGNNLSGDSMRTTESDVRVLESILTDKTLTVRQRKLASARAALRSAQAGYIVWSQRKLASDARSWFLKSLRFSWNRRAAKLFLFTFIPVSLADKLRQVKRRLA